MTVQPPVRPRHYRELVGKAVDLAAPFPAVERPPVQEDERRPLTLPVKRDPVAADLDLIHEDSRWPRDLPRPGPFTPLDRDRHPPST